MNKLIPIFLNSLPILIMVGLIPLIKKDYFLTVAYIVVIVLAFVICKKTKDFVFLIFGFFIMTFFEYIFLKTGVEKFERNSLFGIMPLWLPFLWAYGFVAIKRSVEILLKS